MIMPQMCAEEDVGVHCFSQVRPLTCKCLNKEVAARFQPHAFEPFSQQEFKGSAEHTCKIAAVQLT